MRPNLDTLKSEIEDHLKSSGFAVFHGYSRMMDSQPLVYWDIEGHPDYKDFLLTAKAVDCKLVILHRREFSSDVIDDALEQLQVSDLPTDEQRSIERRLKELRVYEGFTCAIELSFDYEGRVFVFDVQTEWYEELSNLLEDLEFIDSDDGDDDEVEGPISGYFSKN